MDTKMIDLWKPIAFNENWKGGDTSILDDLAPSWFRRRAELKEGNADYEEFIDRLKRQHAIETGVVEKLYDLSDGITETFIREGFVESYLSHDDTNIPPVQLMGYLKSHFEAMDFIFDLVKNERPLTVHFIKSLHQLITKHQDYTTALDSLGNRVQVKLLKGEFKNAENNPRRADGSVFKYCPPVHVNAEMDKLVQTHIELWENKVNPVIIAAWVHHAFTQIHPFQDGNGRIARLISSLTLIRGNLFPFTIKRNDKIKYIGALEKADENFPQELVSLFCNVQKQHIESALNYKSEKTQASFVDVAKLFTEKIDVLNSKTRAQRQQQLEANRKLIFDNVYQLLGSIKTALFEVIPEDKAQIKIKSVRPADKEHFWYMKQISEYATLHNYYFNRYLPRGWLKISFVVSSTQKYDLVISIHHYSYDDSVIAVGSFLEFLEQLPDSKQEPITIPINLKPFTISLEQDSSKQFSNLNQYIRDNVKLALTIITNEIG